MFITVIWRMALDSDFFRWFITSRSSCPLSSIFSWISLVLLYNRKSPPRNKIKPWPLIPPVIQDSLSTKKGFFIAVKSDIPNNNKIRIAIAKNKPILVAFLRWLFSNLPAAIPIKIMLSIPKTISKKVNVSNAIQASGLVKIWKSSNIVNWFL